MRGVKIVIYFQYVVADVLDGESVIVFLMVSMTYVVFIKIMEPY